MDFLRDLYRVLVTHPGETLADLLAFILLVGSVIGMIFLLYGFLG